MPLDVLSAAELQERSFLLLSSQKAHQAITANALLALELDKQPALKEACTNASLMLPESAGVLWALKRRGFVAERLAGIEYAWKLCEQCAQSDWPVFLLGGSEQTLSAAQRRLQDEIPRLQIVGSHHGFFATDQEPKILQLLKEKRPRLTLVALGMPRQDLWIAKHLPLLPPGLYVGVGGSFDVWAGRLKRAPRWFQVFGLEWSYRLYQEPWRWRRMLDLPRFWWRALREPKAPIS
jgi:N-acetylglucosaminyldiphosphoundecaprenol N-acetyl-beta-D-mannosaminyltransferase